MVLPLLDFARMGGCPSWPPESAAPVSMVLNDLNRSDKYLRHLSFFPIDL